jgi:hypothetical protein
MGPTAVTSIALLNFTLPAVRILAATQTGIEITIHNTSSAMITATAISAISDQVCSKNCSNNTSNVIDQDLRATSLVEISGQ